MASQESILSSQQGAQHPRQREQALGRGQLRMGTCGWSDPGIVKCGRFYPASAKTAEQRLSHYSSFFSCVEVDTTTYAITPPSTVKKWLACVDAGFRFHFKAFGLLCGQSMPLTSIPRVAKELPSMQSKMSEWQRVGKDKVSAADLPTDAVHAVWERFNEACLPAFEDGKLGLVIFQFHLGFSPSEPNRDVIRCCRARLNNNFDMAVEFRDRRWLGEGELADTCSFLSDIKATLIASDDLAHEVYQQSSGQQRGANNPPGGWEAGLDRGGLLPVKLKSTVPAHGAYIRLHRRAGCERVIADWEVERWVDRIRRLLSEGGIEGPIWFLWGTDHEDQPVINAKNLAAACPPDMCFDWKAHLQNARRSRKGGLLSFVKVTSRIEETQLAGNTSSRIEETQLAGNTSSRIEETQLARNTSGRGGEEKQSGSGVDQGDHERGATGRVHVETSSLEGSGGGGGDDDSDNDPGRLGGGPRIGQVGGGVICASEVRMKQIGAENSAAGGGGSGSEVGVTGKRGLDRESDRGPCASEIRMKEVMSRATDGARQSTTGGRCQGSWTKAEKGPGEKICASEKRMREIQEGGGRTDCGKVRRLAPGTAAAAASRAGKGGGGSGNSGNGGGAGILQFFGKK